MRDRIEPRLIHKPDEAGRAKARDWRSRHGTDSTIETVSSNFEDNVAHVADQLVAGARYFSYGGDGMASIGGNALAAAISANKCASNDVAIGYLPNGFMNNAARWANSSASVTDVEACQKGVKVYPLRLAFTPNSQTVPTWIRYGWFYASRNFTAEIGSLADAPEIREQRESIPHRALKVAHGLGMALRYYGTSFISRQIAPGREHDQYINGPEMTRIRIAEPTITDPDHMWHYDEELGNPLVLARDVIGGLTTHSLPMKRITRDSHDIRDQQTWQVDGEVIFFNGTPRRLGRRGLSASATRIEAKGRLSVAKSPFGVWVVSPEYGDTVLESAA